MTAKLVKDTLAKLKKLANEKTRAHNIKNGADDNQFGVPMGDIRKVAAELKSNHELALALWDTGHIDARLVATLIITPKKLSLEELEKMERSINFVQVADWFNAYVLKKHPDKEKLRERWMKDENPWVARAGWSLTSERINKDPDGLDFKALLDHIETALPGAEPEAQWTMNFCLAGIGIHSPKHRKRALAIGEALGLYRDYPVSKGCTSPFAPLWINEMVKRQG